MRVLFFLTGINKTNRVSAKLLHLNSHLPFEQQKRKYYCSLKFHTSLQLSSMEKKIQSALISVYYKDGLAPLVNELNRLGVTLYSTGGTQKFIEELGIAACRVETLTTYPSILGGRVKNPSPVCVWRHFGAAR